MRRWVLVAMAVAVVFRVPWGSFKPSAGFQVPRGEFRPQASFRPTANFKAQTKVFAAPHGVFRPTPGFKLQGDFRVKPGAFSFRGQ